MFLTSGCEKSPQEESNLGGINFRDFMGPQEADVRIEEIVGAIGEYGNYSHGVEELSEADDRRKQKATFVHLEVLYQDLVRRLSQTESQLRRLKLKERRESFAYLVPYLTQDEIEKAREDYGSDWSPEGRASYDVVRTNRGFFLVGCDPVESFGTGCKINLYIRNLGSTVFRSVLIETFYGPEYPTDVPRYEVMTRANNRSFETDLRLVPDEWVKYEAFFPQTQPTDFEGLNVSLYLERTRVSRW